MSPERFAHEELPGSDPETFLLHVEFVHAHGIPKGEFTTFSIAGSATSVGPGAEGRQGTRIE